MKLLFVRHGTPILTNKFIYGSLDPDIAPISMTDISPLVQKTVMGNTIWISSTASRALKTASQLQQLFGISATINTDNRLNEQFFGDFEGKDPRKLTGLVDTPRSYWHFSPEFTPPHGESFVDVYVRCVDLIKEIIARRDESILFFTHGGVIRAILSFVLQLNLEQACLFDLPPLSGTLISYEKAIWTIHYVGIK